MALCDILLLNASAACTKATRHFWLLGLSILIKKHKGDVMAVLITGGSGRLGKELKKVFPDALAPTHEELDITNIERLEKYVSQFRFDMTIHCAALAGINQCEENRKLAWQTNVLGTQNLVSACAKFNKNCYFIYISTACVFYGDRGNYSEDDIPYPKNFYSMTKLLGEFVVKSNILIKSLIIRTNFTSREKWPYPKAFVDRFGTYLLADDVAVAIEEITKKVMMGVVHIVGDRQLSMYELAKITTPDIEPMTLADYKGPPLTINMSLDTLRWKKYKIGTAIR
jgi:dTDP-4-dehydrorhamnose reductase